jgi:hypothetical protein
MGMRDPNIIRNVSAYPKSSDASTALVGSQRPKIIAASATKPLPATHVHDPLVSKQGGTGDPAERTPDEYARVSRRR